MKFTQVLTTAALLSAASFTTFANAQKPAPTVSVPVFSACQSDLAASNTQDPSTYFIFSDFYYELEDKRAYAVKALETMTQTFAADTTCANDTVSISLNDIQCHNVGYDICVVPSDKGDFIVSKDYVDSTNIVLAESGFSTLPKVRTRYDDTTLWLPDPALCYSDLLKNRDSQAYGLDGMSYRHYQDLRYVLARTTRDLVSDTAETSNDCAYETQGIETSKMQCIEYNTFGSKICAMTATNGGYFQYITARDGAVHVLFNRWD